MIVRRFWSFVNTFGKSIIIDCPIENFETLGKEYTGHLELYQQQHLFLGHAMSL